MPLTSQSFNSQTQITVRTWRGQTYDITGDLVYWQTTKSISQPQGTFTIALSGNRDSNGDWADKIMAMDYVEIRASANGQKINGQLPIIMRGFVDYSGRSTVMGQTGGPGEPRIQIQGRDYSKLLLDWQVLYLWTQNNQAEMAVAGQGFGLLYNFGISNSSSSITQFFNEAFSKIVSPVTHGIKFGWIPNIPDFTPDFDLPDYQTSLTPVLSYTGSYWNLFSYFASPPFGELFIWDDDSGPKLTARMTPYKAWDGTVPSPAKAINGSTLISPSEIQSYNLGRTDNDVFNYFLTWGDSSQLGQLTMPSFATNPNNGVNTVGQDLYGTRPLIIDSPWINWNDNGNSSTPSSNALNDASELNQWMMAVMKDNQNFRSGTMAVKGRENYKIGQFATPDGWNEEYYIASVSHHFQLFQRWDTTLGLVRGRRTDISSTTVTDANGNPVSQTVSSQSDTTMHYGPR